MLVKTFLETRLAVGRLGWILGYGRVRPTTMVRGVSSCDSARHKLALTSNRNGDDDEQVDVKESRVQNGK
jgi:hypothetical protein